MAAGVSVTRDPGAALNDLGRLLAVLRHAMGFSQPELAFRLEVSQRHLSFVERARARPGRELLARWCDETGATPAQRSATYLLAGYASPLPGLNDPSVWSDETLNFFEALVRGHSPHAAFIFGADWRVIRMNEAGLRQCALLMPNYAGDAGPHGEGFDMIACCADRDGLLSQMTNARAFARSLLSQLQLEATLLPALRRRVAHLADAFEGRFPGLASDSDTVAFPRLCPQFETSVGTLRFRALQSVLAYPQCASVGSPRLETWLPEPA
ncbi:MAG: helix-turn-helix transcriptional regulator [Caulobacter sp.]